MRSAIVLGAGMVGVSSALQLLQRGWSVALVDRKAPGRETSYGNAGIIQSEAVRPYAMPRDLSSLARIALGRTNDVHYRLWSLPKHLGSLLRYWWNSAPKRHEPISSSYAALITRAAGAHEDLIRAAGAGNLVAREGYRDLHRDPAMLDAAIRLAERFHAEHGRKFRILSPAELARAEPALRYTGVGAIHWLDPWTVSDPGALVTAYAELFQRLGGRIIRAEAVTLRPQRNGWSITAEDGPVDAEAAVVALGPWSPELLRRFGYRFPLVRKRGYHLHFAGGALLNLPLIDELNGYAMAPMTGGLRITTGAELAGAEATAAPVQLQRAEAAARQLLDLGSPVEAVPWSGVRPCTPDMLPVIGQAPRHPGLWMNFGHGHQGFTLGPVTGRVLAAMMSNEEPEVAVEPFRPHRY